LTYPQHSFSLHAMALDWTPNWSALFEREAPLTVEIGFGDGKFLAALAKQNPEQNFIGIERAHAPLTWAEKLVRREGLQNIRLVKSDALMALHCLFEPRSVQTIHINFSDPWFKQRQHKRRVIHPAFLAVLTTRLEVGGMVHLATDIQQYAGEIGNALVQTKGLQNCYPSPWMIQRDDPSLMTRYEQKAIAVGRACYYFKWQRSTAPLPNIPVHKELTPMPNAKLDLPLSVGRMIDNFQPMVFRHDDRVVKFMGIYQEPKKPILLFDVLIEEAIVSQRLMLHLEREHDGIYLLTMSAIGYPRATRGVHDAAYHLVEWLVSQDRAARIVDSKIRKPGTPVEADEL
jgi:tRNA (guanine-N7-)-methyltransferase